MIIEGIMTVEEYSQLLIDCKREEMMITESEDQNQTEIRNMIAHHNKMIRSYIKAAKAKQKSNLNKEAKSDWEKALSEVEALEKNIKEVEFTMMQSISGIIASQVAMTIMSICMICYNSILHSVGSDPDVIDVDVTSTGSDGEGKGLLGKANKLLNKLNKSGKKSEKNITIAIILLTCIINVCNTVSVIFKARKEMKKDGTSASNALNQFRASVLKSCEETKKMIKAQLKLVSATVESDERYETKKKED